LPKDIFVKKSFAHIFQIFVIRCQPFYVLCKWLFAKSYFCHITFRQKKISLSTFIVFIPRLRIL
jgi:hypothetical protein